MLSAGVGGLTSDAINDLGLRTFSSFRALRGLGQGVYMTEHK